MQAALFRITIISLVLLLAACSGGGGMQGIPAGAPGNNGAGTASTPTSSDITEFPIAAGDSAPRAITVERDGNPWFLSSNAVNRMTPQGVVTPFSTQEFNQYNNATDIIVGPDGNIWFTANCAVFEALGPCSDQVSVRLVTSTLAGAFTPVAFAGDRSEGTFQSALTVGANSTIWAAIGIGGTVSVNGGAYEQVREDGSFVVPTHPLPQPCLNAPGAPANEYYSANGIARGSDGAIYITASSPCGDFPVPEGVSVVLRVDASTGLITNTYPVPDAQRIAEGADGNLWVTQNGKTNAIGRLTNAGTLTEFPLPTASANPLGIALGNDGQVWFAENASSKIGRISVSGTIAEFSTPTANAGPYGVASLQGECGAGHGDIWFTEANANKIGRIVF